MMQWANHPKAIYYLFGLSFAESSFFPIPPDVMLAPMVLAQRNRAWFYAIGTTIFSVLGGIFGYSIGYFFFKLVYPFIVQFGYANTYEQILQWFQQWGFWVMFFAGFAVIPYKLFTIAAGATSMSLLPFALGSLLGRGGRFFLVTALILIGGPRVEKFIEQHIDRFGWILLLLLITIYGIWRYFQ